MAAVLFLTQRPEIVTEFLGFPQSLHIARYPNVIIDYSREIFTSSYK